MLNLSPLVRVCLCTKPTDLRKGIDGLSGLVETGFEADVLSGHWFVFLNRRRDRVKILAWDHDGLIFYKRLERGTYQVPREGEDHVELDAAELSMLLSGIDMTSARRRKPNRQRGFGRFQEIQHRPERREIFVRRRKISSGDIFGMMMPRICRQAGVHMIRVFVAHRPDNSHFVHQRCTTRQNF